jgi:hypothetical protein
MADRYWVGGTGTWSSTNTANWSTSSGGAGGASVPTAADNVIFDAGSDAGGTFVVTMANSPRLCNDFTASGLDFTMTLAGTSVGLTVSGSLEFPATNFTRTYTGTTTFNATTTGKTITTNGVSISTTNFNGVGGEWTLGSAYIYGVGSITVTNGTFDTSASNYAVTVLSFSSTNSNIRTINLNGSTVTLVSSWNMSTSANATVNAGTSTISMSASSAVFNGGALTYYNVQFTSTTSTTSTKSITGANTFNNLTIATIATAGCNRISISADQTINGTLTATGSDGNRRMFVSSNTTGTARTLTCAAIAAMTDVDFRDITIAGVAAPLSGTRLGDCNGNTDITFGAGVDKYWNLAGGGNWSSTAWATSSGGAVANTNFPLVQDTVIIENTGLNTSATVTINAPYNIGIFDMSTRSNAMTLSIFVPTFYDNLIYNSAITPSGTTTITFSNRSIKTFDSAGKTFDNPITIDAPGGGIQLINNNFVTGVTKLTTLTQGTLDLNDLDWTTGRFNSSNTNVRAIDFGTGEINITGTGSAGVSAAWYVLQGMSTFTVSGTPVVNVTSTGSTAITISQVGAGLSEANSISWNFTGGTYNLRFLNLNVSSAINVDFTGFAGTWLATSTNVKVYGNLTLSTGMSLTATSNTFIFGATSGTKTITTNGKTMDFPVIFNGVGGTWQLQDAMTLGSTRLATFTNGTVDLNGFTLTSGTGTTATGTKNITFNGGTLLLSGSGATAWNNAQPTNFTTTAGTGTGAISMTSASAKTFVGGGSTYNCNLNQGGAGDLTITNSNTFNDITNSVQPATILFTAGTTQTVNDFTLSGTSGNLITIDSTTASQFTLSKASGTVSVSYLDIRDSIGTGGAVWEALTDNGNVDGGNNTGWIFSAVAPSTGNMFMMFH